MYLIVNNKIELQSILVSCGGQKATVAPGESAEIPVFGNKIELTAEASAIDLLDGFEEEKPETFKERVLMKLAKKFAEKVPDIGLNLKVTYEINNISGDVNIDFTEGCDVSGDNKIAEFFDLMPVGYMFPHIIASEGTVTVKKAEPTNKKKFLRLYRNLLLFVNSGLILVDWFFFIPEYLYINLQASDSVIKKKLNKLYSMSVPERILYMDKITEEETEEKKKHGCLTGILKVLLIVGVFVLIGAWANSSEPDIIISEDFQSVYYFDEIFVRTDGKLPEDAKKAFLENYSAAYPLGDGEYDEENYYCFVYEDSNGNRYMWLQDNYNEDFDKEYKDYENPMVYKSIGEQETE